jgi:hypothetical protein
MEAVRKQLQLGQIVAVEELTFGYLLTVQAAGQPGLQVVEIAADYIVLEDGTAGVRRRLPTFTIKAVVAPEPQVPQAA